MRTLVLAFLAGIVVFSLSACGNNTSSPTDAQKEEPELQAKADKAFAEMGPSQHLAQVQRLLGESQDRRISASSISDNLAEAQKHTEAIPVKLPEHQQASNVVTTIRRLYDRAQKSEAAVRSGYETTARGNYAQELERHLLSQGIDATVRAVGKDHQTLRISWAAMSRPIVYNMITGEGMQRQVPGLGFRKVIFTDDGSFSGLSTDSWTYRWSGGAWVQQ